MNMDADWCIYSNEAHILAEFQIATVAQCTL